MQAIEYKIGLIGHTKTGKTSFIRSLLYGGVGNNLITMNPKKLHIPTIGVNVYPYDFTYKNQKYRLNFWDCAGDDKFKGLGKKYLKNSEMILIFKHQSKNNMNFKSWIPNNCQFHYVSVFENNCIENILKTIKTGLFNKQLL